MAYCKYRNFPEVVYRPTAPEMPHTLAFTRRRETGGHVGGERVADRLLGDTWAESASVYRFAATRLTFP